MRRPNILLLYTDQQRWDALAANGNAHIQTPNLDRLAYEGLNFDHCFVQNPVCMPSRASFLTGQYPSTLGITHMGVPLPPDTLTLPRLLRNYGYYSVNIGKLHFLPHANRDHREPHPDYGFDRLEVSDEPGPYEDAYRAWVRRKAPDQLDRISIGLPPAAEVWQREMGLDDGIEHPDERFPKKAVAFRGDATLTHSAFVTERTLDFIDHHTGEPFLCIAGFYSPHSPWVVPQQFLDLYTPEELSLPTFVPELEARRSPSFFSDEELRSAKHGYYAMVSEVDHHVGRILAGLEARGLSEDTLVIFTADHGEWLGEHLMYGKGYPGQDCVSRVPLLIRWPAGVTEPGRTVSRIVEAVDVVPTLLACAGIPIPAHLQGRPWPLDGTFGEIGEGSALMEGTGWKSLRTARYRFISHASGQEALFDLLEDPGEHSNLAGDPAQAETLAELRRLLLERLLKLERPLPRTWPY